VYAISRTCSHNKALDKAVEQSVEQSVEQPVVSLRSLCLLAFAVVVLTVSLAAATLAAGFVWNSETGLAASAAA
jgi:hypothetical protein